MATEFILSVDFVINPYLFGCIGTNLGVTLVNVETGTQSCVCRCKSDIFSVQLDQSVSFQIALSELSTLHVPIPE